MSRYTETIGELNLLYDIFDFDYDVPAGMTKNYLQETFIEQYAYREIAYETYEQWHLKFKHRWLQALEKYRPLFEKTFDVWNSYKSTTVGDSQVQSSNESENRHMPTPITNQVSDAEVPSGFTIGKGGGESSSQATSTSTRQTKTDVALAREYVEQYITTVNLFLNEFKSLMFGRY